MKLYAQNKLMPEHLVAITKPAGFKNVGGLHPPHPTSHVLSSNILMGYVVDPKLMRIDCEHSGQRENSIKYRIFFCLPVIHIQQL